jgi:hypothetical protein
MNKEKQEGNKIKIKIKKQQKYTTQNVDISIN